MEGPARAGHDPGGGLRLERPDFRQPIPDRQGDHGDQLERPSLLRASAGKSRRFRSGKGPPKGRGQRRRENSPWRIARKLAPMKNLTTKRGLRCAIYTRVSTDQGLEQVVREQLWRYYPKALELGDDLAADWFLDLWALAPTPAKAARPRESRVAGLLKAHRIRRLEAAEVLRILRQKPLVVRQWRDRS